MEINENGNGLTRVMSTEADSAVIEGSRNLLIGLSGSDTIEVTGSYNTIYGGANRYADETTVNAGDSDVLQITGNDNLIFTDGGPDTVNVTGDANLIHTGAGADRATLSGDDNLMFLEGDGTLEAHGDDNLIELSGVGFIDNDGERSLIFARADGSTIRSTGANNRIYITKGLLKVSGEETQMELANNASVESDGVTTGVIYVQGSEAPIHFNGLEAKINSTTEGYATLTVEDDEITAVNGLATDVTVTGLSAATLELRGEPVVDGIKYTVGSLFVGGEAVISLHEGAIYGLDGLESLQMDQAGVYTVNGSVLTVAAGAQIMGTTDWAGIRMPWNSDDDASVVGTDGNDFILSLGKRATIDTKLGVDLVEIMASQREYIKVGAGSSVMAEPFEYGFEDTADALIFDVDDMSTLNAEFTGEGVIFELGGGRIQMSELADDSVNVNVQVGGVLKKVTAINSGSEVGYDGVADFYALGADGTLTGLTGTAAVDDLIISTNATLDVTGRGYGGGGNEVGGIFGLSAGSTIAISDAHGANNINYAVNEAGTALTRTDNGQEVWSGTAKELSTLDFLTVDFDQYYGGDVRTKTDALLKKYIKVDGNKLTLDMATAQSNLDARAAAMVERLGESATAEEVISELNTEFEDIFGVELYEIFSDAAVDYWRNRISALIAEGADTTGVLENTLLRVPALIKEQFNTLSGTMGMQTFFKEEAALLSTESLLTGNAGLASLMEEVFASDAARSLVNSILTGYRDRLLNIVADDRFELVIAGADSTTHNGFMLGLSGKSVLDASRLKTDGNVLFGNYGGAERLKGASKVADTLVAGANDTIVAGAGDWIVFADGESTIESILQSIGSSEIPLTISSADFEDNHSRQVIEIGSDATATVIGFEVGFEDASTMSSDVLKVDDASDVKFEFIDSGLKVLDGEGNLLLATDDAALTGATVQTAFSDSRTAQPYADTELLIVDGDGEHKVRAYYTNEINVGIDDAELHYVSGGVNEIMITGAGSVMGLSAGDTILTNGAYETAASGNDVLLSVASGSAVLKDALNLGQININGANIHIENDLTIRNTLDNVTVEGTDGDDSITSNGSDVTINGLGGADIITVDGAGNAIMVEGTLTVEGFDGDDVLIFADGLMDKAVDFADGGLLFYTDTVMSPEVEPERVLLKGITSTAEMKLRYGADGEDEDYVFISDGDIYKASSSAGRTFIGILRGGVDFSGVTDALNITLGTDDNEAVDLKFGNIDTIIGGAGSTNIVGTTKDEALTVGKGQTTIDGKGGNDIIKGVKADDVVIFDGNVTATVDNNLIVTGTDGVSTVEMESGALIIANGHSIVGAEAFTVDNSGATVDAPNGAVTVDGYRYTVAGDADGVQIIGNSVTGADAGSTIMMADKGEYFINGARYTFAGDNGFVRFTDLLQGDTLTLRGSSWVFYEEEYGTVIAGDDRTFIDTASASLTVAMGAQTTLNTYKGADILSYDSSTRSGFMVRDEVGFVDGGISISADNVIRGLTDNSARLFKGGVETLTAWTGSDGLLDRSTVDGREMLIANVDNATVISSARNDTIDVRADGVKVRYGDGRDTVIGDAILYQDAYTDKKVRFTDDGLKFFDNRNSLLLKDVNTSTNVTWHFGDETLNAVYVADGDDYAVETLANEYVGMTRNTGVDFSAVEDIYIYNVENIGRVTLGGSNSTFESSNAKQTIVAGAGDDVIELSKGRDHIYNFDAANDRLVADGDCTVKVKGNDLLISGDNGQQALLVDLATIDSAISINDKLIKAGAAMSFDDAVTNYVGSNNATLTVGDSANIWLGGADGKNYANIKAVDASDNDGNVLIAGTSAKEILIGGYGSNSLWGGNGFDTLVGGAGSNEFFYVAGNGRDVIENANADDVVNLLDISIDDINIYIDEQSTALKFNDGGRLLINSTAELNYRINGAQYTLNRSEKLFERK